MAYSDFLGNPFDASNASVARAIDDFVDGMLSYETRAANILKAADNAPNDALANIYAAMLHMFAEAPSAPANAAPYVARAKAAAPTSRREQLALVLTEAWIAGDIPRAETIGAEINAAYPRDLLIAKLRQYFAFNHGDFPAMLRIAEEVASYNDDVAQMHGMLAFAYEQCDRLGDAEREARRALEIKSKEPWAHHALAHVMLTQGRIDEGAAFLEGVRGTWVDLNSFMLTHNYWHLGLFYLSQGRFDEALALYDQYIWGADKDYSQDQIGAASYLARLEFAGIDVGDRWTELARYLSPRAHDVEQPFLSLQYLLGLERAHDPAAATLAGEIERMAHGAPPHSRDAWANAARPAALGIRAYGRGDFAEAAAQLGAAADHLISIGGSHAQRDLFDQLRLDALIRAADNEAARAMLEHRRTHDPDGVPLNTALSEIYLKLGRPKDADLAIARANRTRAKF